MCVCEVLSAILTDAEDSTVILGSCCCLASLLNAISPAKRPLIAFLARVRMCGQAHADVALRHTVEKTELNSEASMQQTSTVKFNEMIKG